MFGTRWAVLGPVGVVVTVFAVALVLMTSCAQPKVESAKEVVSDAAQQMTLDPTVVDPGRYAVEFENDRVRILRIKYGAGEEGTRHFHPDHAAVFLTDFHGQMINPDGSTQEVSLQAGEHIVVPAGEHQGKNLGGDLEAVAIEIKSGASGATIEPDAVVVDPDHYTAEFEDDKVRILRIAYGPGEESAMHFHPDSVAVFLTDHLVQMTMPDGSTSEVSASAGDTLFLPAGQHLPKNISQQPWEVVLVELK